MSAASKFSNITKWLKLFTYISGVVLLISNNPVDRLKFIIPLSLLVFFINYSRDYCFADNKPLPFLWASLALEVILIIGVGVFDSENINTLFYYVCIASTIIIHPFIYSIPIALAFTISTFIIDASRAGFHDITASAVPMLLSTGVSTVFVMAMSYLVKLQLREKERLAHTNAELEQAYKKLIENSALSQKLTIEQERTRMARELHDTLAHTMTSLIVQLAICKKLAPAECERLQDELEKAQEISKSGFNDVKRSIKALRPQVMEDKDFFDSIASMINNTMDNGKVHIHFNNQLPHGMHLSSQLEIALFRVIQESITNSLRHGEATDIQIDMKQNNNKLCLCIADNGKGCANIKKGYGTQGIRERIGNLDGSVEFSSSPGKGFKTTISLPYEVTA